MCWRRQLLSCFLKNCQGKKKIKFPQPHLQKIQKNRTFLFNCVALTAATNKSLQVEEAVAQLFPQELSRQKKIKFPQPHLQKIQKNRTFLFNCVALTAATNKSLLQQLFLQEQLNFLHEKLLKFLLEIFDTKAKLHFAYTSKNMTNDETGKNWMSKTLSLKSFLNDPR